MHEIQQVKTAHRTDAAAKPVITTDALPRLLVVDDEEVICQIVQGFLGSDGWEVDACQTVDDGLAMLAVREYPVVLCDVNMPGDSALILRKVRTSRAATQVVMITGDPTISTIREALQQGAYEYIPKPFRREELARIAFRALEKFRLLKEQERLLAENASYRGQLEELLKRRSDQLRESELRYRALFYRAVDAIFLADAATGRICDLNAAAARLLETQSAALLNRSLHDVFAGQLNDALAECDGDKHQEWRFDRLTLRTDAGRIRYVQVSAGRVEFENQSCLQIVARDISEQLSLAERNELMELELLSEQRLAAIGLLVSGIAHNINTPLMGIYGTAQLLKMKHPELTDADGIITQVERINGIVRNLMWKSRQEQDTRFQVIDLNLLLHEELKFLEADLDFKHNVEKQYAFADDMPAIMGRYSDFSQSLTNVIRNALDAMHDREDRRLTVTTAVVDGVVRISVADNGCGIPPENADHIFLPFFTTKPLAGRSGESTPTGTGLGLSTVKKLLLHYGAQFEIDSTPGCGTTFTIVIPVAANSPPEQIDSDED